MAIFPTNIDSPGEVRTRTPDGRDLVFLTGTAVFNFQGTGQTVVRDDLLISIGPVWRRVDDVAPVASLASIANVNVANNALWAADNCRFVIPADRRILLSVRIAVRDNDGFLLRVSFQATAIGLL